MAEEEDECLVVLVVVVAAAAEMVSRLEAGAWQQSVGGPLREAIDRDLLAAPRLQSSPPSPVLLLFYPTYSNPSSTSSPPPPRSPFTTPLHTYQFTPPPSFQFDSHSSLLLLAASDKQTPRSFPLLSSPPQQAVADDESNDDGDGYGNGPGQTPFPLSTSQSFNSLLSLSLSLPLSLRLRFSWIQPRYRSLSARLSSTQTHRQQGKAREVTITLQNSGTDGKE